MAGQSMPGMYPDLGPEVNVPDPLIAAALPEFHYSILDAVVSPMVDAATQLTDDQLSDLRQVVTVLRKKAQQCVRQQQTILNQLADQLLMEQRTHIAQQQSMLMDLQQQLSSQSITQPHIPPPSLATVPGLGQSPVSGGMGAGPITSGGMNNAIQSPTENAQVLSHPPSSTPSFVGSVSSVHSALSPGPSGSGGTSGQSQTTVQAVPGQSPGATSTVGCPPPTIIVNVPPCPTLPQPGGGGGNKGGGGSGDEDIPPIEPVFEPAKDPLVAAPAPELTEGGPFTDDPPEVFLPPCTSWATDTDELCRTVEEWLEPLKIIGDACLAVAVKVAQADAYITGGLATIVWTYTTPVVPIAVNRTILTTEEARFAIKQCWAIVGDQIEDGDSALVGAWAVRAMLDTIEAAGPNALSPQAAANFTLQLTFKFPQLRQVIEYLISYLAPCNVPSVGDAQRLYLADQADLRWLECVSKLNGQDKNIAWRQARAERARLRDEDVVREWYRFFRKNTEVSAELRELGYLDGTDADRLMRAREYIPPVQDLIRFTVKEVFSPRDFGNDAMIAEFTEQVGLRELMRANAIVPIEFAPESSAALDALLAKFGKEVPTLKEKGNGRFEFDVPFAYWQAHYIHASPTQATEMLHRLRKNRVDRYKFVDAKGETKTPEPFLIDDLRLLLRITDYHPLWRDRLAAIGFTTLGRIDIRRIYGVGGFGNPLGDKGFALDAKGNIVANGIAEKELVERYMDAGYNDVDAKALAHFTAVDFDNKDIGGRKKKAATLACKSIKAGIIDDKQAFKLLDNVGFSIEEQGVLVSNCHAELDYEMAVEGIKAIKKMFLRGMIDVATTNGYLTELGVIPERRSRYITLWTIELRGREKSIGAAQMCQWRADGLISDGEMLERLIRIGYLPIDANRIIRHCQIGQAAKGSKEIKAKLKADDAMLRKAISLRTPTTMYDWYRKGLLSEENILATFYEQGYAILDAVRWIRANINESFVYVPGQEKGDTGASDKQAAPAGQPSGGK